MSYNNQFDLTLDTLAPNGCSITPNKSYSSSNESFIISDNNTGAAYMRIWWDKLSTGLIEDAPNTWVDYATSKSSNIQTSPTGATNGKYYGHVQFKDIVANTSSIFDSTFFIYDTIAPLINTITAVNANAINAANNKFVKRGSTVTVSITGIRDDPYATTDVSGIKKLEINVAQNNVTFLHDEILATSIINNAYSFSFIVPEEATNGIIDISAKAIDNADNESTEAYTSVTVDLSQANASLRLCYADNSTSLPNIINFVNYKAEISLTDTTSNDNAKVVGYKIWEGSSEPSSWTTTETYYSGTITKTGLNFSPADGAKVVHAKILDAAGNETELTPISIILDRTNPSITSFFISNGVQVDNKIYLPKSSLGTNTYPYAATLNAAWSDTHMATFAEDTSAVVIKINNDAVIARSSRYEASPCSFTLNNLNMSEGKNTLTIMVIDTAGNIATKSIDVYCDYTGPAFVDTDLVLDPHNATMMNSTGWTNEIFDIQLPTITDIPTAANSASGLSTINIWCSNISNDTTPKGTDIPFADISGRDVLKSQINFTNISRNITNYIHLQVKDKVGNISNFHSDVFGFDDRAPELQSAVFGKNHYNTTAAQITLYINERSGNESGVHMYLITGDLASPVYGELNTAQYYGSFTVPVTLSDTYDAVNRKIDKYVTVKIMDQAGNMSTERTIHTCYDISAPAAHLELYHPTRLEVKESPSADPKFRAKFYYSLLEEYGLQFKLWGNFTCSDNDIQTGTTEANASWNGYNPTHNAGFSPEDFQLTTNLIGDPDSNNDVIVNLQFKDTADNLSNIVTQSFKVDIGTPTSELYAKYSRISCLDVPRWAPVNESVKVDNTYRDYISPSGNKDYNSDTYYNADTIYLEITPSKPIKRYFIVAYPSITEATAGVYNDGQIIGTTFGSQNVTGYGLEVAKTIICKIKGKDYQAALQEAESLKDQETVDGAHVLVAYIQDTGDRWSANINPEVDYLLLDMNDEPLTDITGDPLTVLPPEE